jgi:GNAT superfamily N-acetyltransferase
MWIGIDVDPDERRRGIGGALHDALERIAREQRVTRLDAEATEKVPEGPRFLQKRGYKEMKRNWESRLDVNAFDPAAFAKAPGRVAEQGIRVTTLADEMGRDGEEAIRRAHELEMEASRDIPLIDPFTPLAYEHWKKEQFEAPSALPEAWFLAVDRDGRFLAVSNLFASLDDTTFLWQGFTGVRREARGRGLAMALKLRTVEYARARGKREIKTWNDQRNRSMLRINEALGFVKQPAWIEFEKELASARS